MEFNPPVVTATYWVVIAFLFFGLAGFFRRVSLTGKENWDKSFQPVEPSLDASASPMASTKTGITGCFTWIIGWFGVVLFLLLGLDFLFFQGAFSQIVWSGIVDRLAA